MARDRELGNVPSFSPTFTFGHSFFFIDEGSFILA